MAKKNQSKNIGERTIVTNYYGTSGKVLLWYNRAKDPENAIDLAFKHMRRNDYGAFVAEVFNEDGGELFAVIIHTLVGKIVTLFEKDPSTKVIVTDFDARVVQEVTEAKEQLELVNTILRESRLEKKLQERNHG